MSKRIVRNKLTGQQVVCYRHLIHGNYLFIPINDLWEVVE